LRCPTTSSSLVAALKAEALRLGDGARAGIYTPSSFAAETRPPWVRRPALERCDGNRRGRLEADKHRSRFTCSTQRIAVEDILLYRVQAQSRRSNGRNNIGSNIQIYFCDRSLNQGGKLAPTAGDALICFGVLPQRGAAQAQRGQPAQRRQPGSPRSAHRNGRDHPREGVPQAGRSLAHRQGWPVEGQMVSQRRPRNQGTFPPHLKRIGSRRGAARCGAARDVQGRSVRRGTMRAGATRCSADGVWTAAGPRGGVVSAGR
jgi:hypothetical protein